MGNKDGDRLRRRAEVLSALASETRLMLLEHLEDGEMSVSDLTEAAGLDISTISRHLSVLKSAGIVSCMSKGNRRLYSLRASCVLGFLDCVEDLLDEGSGLCTRDIRKRMEEMA